MYNSEACATTRLGTKVTSKKHAPVASFFPCPVAMFFAIPHLFHVRKLKIFLGGSQQQIDAEFVLCCIEIATTEERITFLRSACAAAPYSMRLFFVSVPAER